MRLHIRDIWSNQANPTLNTLTGLPTVVNIHDQSSGSYAVYSAPPDSADCDWYSLCLPSSVTSFYLDAVGVSSTSCTKSAGQSGTFETKSIPSGSTNAWLYYAGTSSTISSDYTSATMGSSAFVLTSNSSGVPGNTCNGDAGPASPSGVVTVYFRWPAGDPAVTGFAGSDCEQMNLKFSTPPYPSSLKVQGALPGECSDLGATLELQNSNCPWYVLYLPTSAWASGAPSIQFGYPSFTQSSIYTPGIQLPTLANIPSSNSIWIAYGGPPDNGDGGEGTPCLDYSERSDSYHIYNSNPGPGYTNCGGSGTVTLDPCNPPVPADYSTVHFRYLWAGQKTFTFFPNAQFMPTYIILRVMGSTTTDDVTCFREAGRPWFNCSVPNADFAAGTTWVAADISHMPEWNTVTPRPFPVTPGEYWIRWNYGKPDVEGDFAQLDVQPPSNTTAPTFATFDYYPDGTGGDWSATGDWNDSACAAKPPPTPPQCGYQGWFPYSVTGYEYPFGASLANTYAQSDQVQNLLNTFICQRYEIWKSNYVETSNLVCGTGTARVKTDPPQTVSEGQGYGIAISAAIGDKTTFDALWNFSRHFLSESADKYCGGLMGWMWDGTIACRPIDSPCDPENESCSGNEDSAFDGDVDIGIGLVFAALQWPEYMDAATNWLLKMECEVNSIYDGKWNYPSKGDTWDKNCQNYPGQPCSYQAGQDGQVDLSYYPPGYFRVFGDFLSAYLDPTVYSNSERQSHHDFWYKTASTVYEMFERCYDQSGVNPGLVQTFGTYSAPCSISGSNYDWPRSLWRTGVDAAWFGNNFSLPENAPNSSRHYSSKTEMQAKIDNIQDYYNNFYVNNPPVPNANMFSTICDGLVPAGTVSNCDPGSGHNSDFVNTAMCPYVSIFDDGQQTTGAIRRQALEESVSTTVENDHYYQESIGVYTMLFLSGNFPNPMTVPR